MTALRVAVSRVLDLLVRGRRDQRLSEEIQAHLDLLTDEYVGAGLSAADARLAARKAFGGTDRVTALYRHQRGLPWVNGLAQDTRFALRLLLRDRVFTATAVMVLALGIGVNNLFFTLVYAHTMRGLPIDHPERVLYVSTLDERGADRRVSLPDFEDIGAAQRSFVGVAAFMDASVALGDAGRAPDRFEGAFVSANAFSLVGAEPILGRGFSSDDDHRGAAPVVVLGASAWRARYDRDPSILGRAVLINGLPSTVVGVMPDRSGLPSTAGVFLPLGQVPGPASVARGARTLRVFGRVRDGVPVADAAAEVGSIADRLARDHPDTNRNVRARVVPINDRMLGRLEGAWLAFITAGFVIVAIACANAANLMLARALSRAPEIAIRTALGASRPRVVRQLLVESAMLAAIGGAVGLVFSTGGVRLFRAAIPENVLPYWIDYSMDGRVLAALVAVSFGTVFVFGLIPAVQASRTDVNRVLKAGDLTGTSRHGSHIWRTAFLTTQLALVVVLVAQLGIANLTARTGVATDDVVATTDVVAASISLPPEKYASAERRVAFYDELARQMHSAPGIDGVALASATPLGGAVERRLRVVDGPPAASDTAPAVWMVAIGPDYFKTLDIGLIRGREFSTADGATGEPNAVVNDQFARMFFADRDPIGRRIGLPVPGSSSDAQALTIIGVAPSIRQRTRPDPDPIVYVPLRQDAPATVVLLARSRENTAHVTNDLKQAALAIDPNLPLYRMRTMARVVEEAEWNGRVSARLALTLTLLSVLLAGVGLYAVSAHIVALRTREIGVRMALGAGPAAVVRVLLGHMRTPLVFGSLIGAAGTIAWDAAFSTGRAGVRATDPLSLALTGLAMAGVTLAACWAPARRAMKMDSSAALKHP